MGLSVIKRPYGYSIGDYKYPTVSITSSSGDALFDVGTHGLSTGAVIYIFSSLDSYNGFWTITVISGSTFKLQNPSGGFVQFINNAINQYFRYAVSLYAHRWNCVHLPIVYQLKSTLWPNNTVDTSRTVSSFANDSNYVELTLSGSLGTFNELAYVKISGATSTAVNGNWQILTKTSTSVVTINLPYSSGYNFTGGSVILYYNNYHISVNIYAGLDSSHKWGNYIPYSKVLNVSVVPGSDNIASFNLNEYLKGSLNILKNNLVLDTLPNNTDFCTQFYIEYEESYDSSDGSIVTTYESGFTSDKSSFQGYAVNAKLPFKSRHQGSLSQYIYGFTTRQKFLTQFEIPTLFDGKYFDLSFIVDENIETVNLYLIQELYLNSVYQSTNYNRIGSGTTNLGIYRNSLRRISNEDQQKVYLGAFSILFPPDSDLWTIYGSTWTSRNPTQFIKNFSGTTSIYSYQDIFIPSGTTIILNYTVEITGFSGINAAVTFSLVDNTNSSTAQTDSYLSGGSTFTADGVYSVSQSLRADDNLTTRLFMSCSKINGNALVTVTITPGVVGTTSIFSETKIINIDSSCYDQNYYLTWLNSLGGFDYWNFTGRSDHDKQIDAVSTQEKNIFTTWPKSWGEFADIIQGESRRKVKFVYNLRSQNVTKDQLDAISGIKDSPLVQLIYDQTISYNSNGDPRSLPDDSFKQTRTLLIDKQSFHIRKDGDKTFNISFQASYTDYISNQEL